MPSTTLSASLPTQTQVQPVRTTHNRRKSMPDRSPPFPAVSQLRHRDQPKPWSIFRPEIPAAAECSPHAGRGHWMLSPRRWIWSRRRGSGLDHAWSARVEDEVSRRDDRGNDDAEPRLLPCHGSAAQINRAKQALKRTTRDSYLDPHDVADGVHRGHCVAGRHRQQNTAPQADDVIDTIRQVLEMEGQFDLSE